MSQFLAAVWLLQKALSYGGLVMALAGVAIFGWYFIRLNAVAAKSDAAEIPAESWRGPGAQFGLIVFAAGMGLAMASIILTSAPDGRH